jgi:hypothetical protein
MKNAKTLTAFASGLALLGGSVLIAATPAQAWYPPGAGRIECGAKSGYQGTCSPYHPHKSWQRPCNPRQRCRG